MDFEKAYSTVHLDGTREYSFSSYYQHCSSVAAVFIFAYTLIFFVCMIGNTLVCIIVLKNKRMRTVTNIFILNLAIIDLLVGIFCLPITLVDNLITGWPFDEVICKMSGLIKGASVSASVFTLVTIAVDRFRCIIHPFQKKLTLRQAIVIIVFIWALAVIIMCPSAITLTVSLDDYHLMVDTDNSTYPMYTCWEAWSDQGMLTDYGNLTTSQLNVVAMYIFPFAHWWSLSGDPAVRVTGAWTHNRVFVKHERSCQRDKGRTKCWEEEKLNELLLEDLN
ncbi:neuropeptide FF receptor 1-like [Osmerus mordax]|uniref:neuropeptide FF receptor 1-like n=1 Tax=Osmerus mordax TaxID=8014 RepID=UPI0035108E32